MKLWACLSVIRQVLGHSTISLHDLELQLSSTVMMIVRLGSGSHVGFAPKALVMAALHNLLECHDGSDVSCGHLNVQALVLHLVPLLQNAAESPGAGSCPEYSYLGYLLCRLFTACDIRWCP